MRENIDNYNEPMNQKQLIPIFNYFHNAFEKPEPFTTDLIIMNQKLINPRQKIIRMDSLRTRSFFFDQQLKNQLQIMLTHYCRIQSLQYKQGLNEIAAPFIYFRKIGVSLGICEILFHHFFTKYCMNFYYDKDFNSIEMFSKMFSIVLKYHVPSVHRFLEWHKIEPQIFCISWLMTLFSSKISLKMTYELWSFYIAENDKFLLFFLAVAIILFNKENIIQTKNVNILQTITNLVFKDSHEMNTVILTSVLIRNNTPCSLVIFFRDRMIFQKRENYQIISRLLQHIQNLNLFLVLPNEMIMDGHFKKGLCEKDCYFCDLRKPIKQRGDESESLKSLFRSANDIKEMNYEKEFVIVDVRRNQIMPIKYHGTVFSIDIEEDIEEIEQKFLSKFMEEKGKKHFLFILTVFSFQDIENCDQRQLDICKDMLTILISMSFPFLSILQGGYTAFFPISEEQQSTSVYGYENLVKEEEVKLPHKFELGINDMYKMGKGLLNHELFAMVGINEIMLICGNSLLILGKSEGKERLINYFKHNNSIIEYLYSKVNKKENLEVRKMVRVTRIKKISMKLYNKNVMVILHESCKLHDCQIGSISRWMEKKKDEKCECEKESRKIIFDFQSMEDVNKCTQLITQRYRDLKELKKK